MPDALAAIFLHALGAKVRYRPAYPPLRGPWRPEPWRVIGRMLIQRLGRRDAVSFSIEPWTLLLSREDERPRNVWARQLAPWPIPKKETCAHA